MPSVRAPLVGARQVDGGLERRPGQAQFAPQVADRVPAVCEELRLGLLGAAQQRPPRSGPGHQPARQRLARSRSGNRSRPRARRTARRGPGRARPAAQTSAARPSSAARRRSVATRSAGRVPRARQHQASGQESTWRRRKPRPPAARRARTRGWPPRARLRWSRWVTQADRGHVTSPGRVSAPPCAGRDFLALHEEGVGGEHSAVAYGHAVMDHGADPEVQPAPIADRSDLNVPSSCEWHWILLPAFSMASSPIETSVRSVR